MIELLRICYEFCKTGLFAVGGGMATLPFLSKMGETYGWFTAEELANMIAISESTPGPIGVNMATYVGFTTFGVLGGLVATLSLVFPSVVVILIIARMLDAYQKNPIVQNVFAFMRPAVAGLIAAAGWEVLQIALFFHSEAGMTLNWIAAGIFVAMTALMHVKQLKKIHPIVYIGIGAVLGVVLKM